MTPTLETIEAEALALHNAGQSFVQVEGLVRGLKVLVRISGTMVNRGTHTGEVSRWDYKLEGKRISKAALIEKLEVKPDGLSPVRS